MSRYDSRTTLFNPKGRLYQVEYALEAINHASLALGILAEDGVVLAAEKKVISKLLEPIRNEKLYLIDKHVGCAVAGVTADANYIINELREQSQIYKYTYNEPMLISEHVTSIANDMQYYTQHGGLRPYGVAILIAGWDAVNGFQLLHVEPSGVMLGWKAHAIGKNSPLAISSMREALTEPTGENMAGEEKKINLEEAKKLATKTLKKGTENLTKDNVEMATLSLDGAGNPSFVFMGKEEIEQLLEEE